MFLTVKTTFFFPSPDGHIDVQKHGLCTLRSYFPWVFLRERRFGSWVFFSSGSDGKAFNDGSSWSGSEETYLNRDMEPEQQGVSLSPLKPHGTAAVFLCCSMTSSAHVLKLNLFITQVVVGKMKLSYFFFFSLKGFCATAVKGSLRLGTYCKRDHPLGLIPGNVVWACCACQEG